MPYKQNQSPWSKKVHGMSKKRLNRLIQEYTGVGKAYTESWDDAMWASEQLKVLHHPRYFARMQTGNWAVRDQMVQISVATAPTGPLAIARAIVIVVGGQGKDWSNKHEDPDRSGWRGGGFRGRSVQEVQLRKPVHRART